MAKSVVSSSAQADGCLRPLQFESELQAFESAFAKEPKSSFSWSYQQFLETALSSRTWVLYNKATPCAIGCFSGFAEDWELILCLTHPDFRGQNKMYELLQELLSTEFANKRVFLEVHPANSSALQLYQRLGFERLGERSNYYKDGASALVYRHAC